jgi:aryl-alcohol dehydrogenase-like predicted oxidoreductase
MTKQIAQKLVLGSAQFGMSYGIANTVGRPHAGTVRAILGRAARAGIDTIDTAHSYGDAELVLGQLLSDNQHFRIISKTLPFPAEFGTADNLVEVRTAFKTSLDRLNQRCLEALLVHHAGDLLGSSGDRLWSWLQSVRSSGLAGKIGVSVYTPEELSAVLDRYSIQIVQLPYNVYDQRFARAGLLDRLRSAGVEVHARSAFLQGLLLLSPEQLRGQFETIRMHQHQFHGAMAQNGMTPLAGCLSVSLNDPRVDFVVVGCESVQQMEQILEGADQARSIPRIEQFQLLDEDIINPSRWVQ